MCVRSLHLQDINFLIALVSMEFASLLKQIDSMLPQNVEHLLVEHFHVIMAAHVFMAADVAGAVVVCCY